MLSFKLFFESKSSNKPYYINNGISVMQIPTMFGELRSKKKKLDESKALMHDDDDDEEHGHVSKGLTQSKPFHKMSPNEMSDHLHKHYGSHVSEEDSKHIRHYTSSEPSRSISKALQDSHRWDHHPTRHMDDDEEKAHEAIHRNARPSEHEFHVYHGASANVLRATNDSRNKDGLVHFPSHLSTTHDHDTAKHFAHRAANSDRRNGDAMSYHHIMKIKVKKGDKILHVSQHSKHSDEHETVIPSGTTLKHVKTTYHHYEGDHVEGAKPGEKYRVAVHHYEIHKQE